MDNNSDAEFLSWFASQNGVLDPSVGLSFFKDDGGRGAIALADIPVSRFCMKLSIQRSGLPISGYFTGGSCPLLTSEDTYFVYTDIFTAKSVWYRSMGDCGTG
jgi:hypothetical protein